MYSQQIHCRIEIKTTVTHNTIFIRLPQVLIDAADVLTQANHGQQTQFSSSICFTVFVSTDPNSIRFDR